MPHNPKPLTLNPNNYVFGSGLSSKATNQKKVPFGMLPPYTSSPS